MEIKSQRRCSMILKRTLMGALFLCFAVSIGAGVLTHEVQYTETQLVIEPYDGYDVVRYGDLPSANPEGAPLLPVQALSFLIPPDAEVTSVEIISSEQA
jgi:hypothetical protein